MLYLNFYTKNHLFVIISSYCYIIIMNRLLKKLKEFGLIFTIDTENEEDIIQISKALKKADVPVVLFSENKNTEFDRIRISNENEDMFIGAECSGQLHNLKKAAASGAHFIIGKKLETEVVESALSSGYDLIIKVNSIEDIKRAAEQGIEAVLVECNSKKMDELIQFTLFETGLYLFIEDDRENLPIEKWRNHRQMIAFIIKRPFKNCKPEEIYSDAVSLINHLTGVRFSRLLLRADSDRTSEAEMFSAVSVVPLIKGCRRDLLEIKVKDMDRMIAHLKWKGIYMDPLSAKMEGEKIMETELYSNFMGWPVKLINLS